MDHDQTSRHGNVLVIAVPTAQTDVQVPYRKVGAGPLDTAAVHIDTAETTTTTAYDTLTVQLQNSSGAVLTTLATYSNLNKNTGYAQKTFDVSAYKGQAVKIYFKGVEDSLDQTSFVIDDVSLRAR